MIKETIGNINKTHDPTEMIVQKDSTVTPVDTILIDENLLNIESNKPKKCNVDSLYLVAVKIIKESEGWHSQKHYPYVGYGHKLNAGDNFDSNIDEDFATEILKKDLNQKISAFKEYGKDSLILGVLAYNVGEWKLKGGHGYPKSSLIKAIENNESDSVIKAHYVSYRLWNGKVIPSIERRRHREFNNLYR